MVKIISGLILVGVSYLGFAFASGDKSIYGETVDTNIYKTTSAKEDIQKIKETNEKIIKVLDSLMKE